MKEKLEAAANIAVILLAAVIGYVLLKDRIVPKGPQPTPRAGDRLANLPELAWSAQDQTLVLALKDGCHFCEQSMPFYRKLAALEKGNRLRARLVAVFPDDPSTVQRVVAAQKLDVQALPQVDLSLVKVNATPTLILVDRQGRVSHVWIGQLPPNTEQEVISTVGKAAAAL